MGGLACGGKGPDGLYRVETLRHDMTFSWFWGPLIGHAMGKGHLFPEFPVATQPRFRVWVENVRLAIQGMDAVPSWESILDGPRHPNQRFQEVVFTQLMTNMALETLNEANAYALEAAEAAARRYNDAARARKA